MMCFERSTKDISTNKPVTASHCIFDKAILLRFLRSMRFWTFGSGFLVSSLSEFHDLPKRLWLLTIFLCRMFTFSPMTVFSDCELQLFGRAWSNRSSSFISSSREFCIHAESDIASPEMSSSAYFGATS
jgi:hypothetical protein